MQHIINIIASRIILSIALVFMCLASYAYAAEDVKLIGVQTRSVPGSKAQILLEFSGTPPDPTGFALNNPAKMIFDFPGVKSSLDEKSSSQILTLGVVKGLNFVVSGKVTRMVVDVLSIVPYHIDTDRDKLIITFDNDIKTETTKAGSGAYTISSIDFRRGDNGQGRVIVGLSDDQIPIDFKDDGQQLVAEFRGASISDNLVRKYDVSDFATNISKISVEREKNNVLLKIETKGEYDDVAYLLGKEFVVEVRPLSAEAQAALKSQKFKFTGEKISLNFQDISIRSVLQLIADFTNTNMVISDAVTGNVTLHLDDVPWDQALDFILNSKGLAKRVTGKVMLIAPSEEIAAREQLDLASQQQTQSLAPLESEYVQIDYAKAADMVSILKSAADNSLLSSRGSVTVDARTNTLLIKDTAENISNIKQLLSHLDIPVRQVVIETQIVETTDTLSDALGIRFGGAAFAQLGKYTMGVGPDMTLARQFANNPNSLTSSSDKLFFDFTAPDKNSVLGLAFARLPNGTLIDLELQAAESESKSKTIAKPKLITLDQQQASIETGQEIPFTTTSQAGATPTTTFKKAVLRLQVTPQITPNDKITMALDINNDSVGEVVNGQSAINTTSITTNVLVDNGETIVLGGVYKFSDTDTLNAVPYLSRIPVLGRLFSAYDDKTIRTEILIFVTPRIAKALFTK